MKSTKTKFVSLNLTDHARDVLRGRTIELAHVIGIPDGRRVTMSRVVLAALHVAMQHRDEFIARLREEA